MAGIIIGEADVKVGADTSTTAADIKAGLTESLAAEDAFADESRNRGQNAGDGFGKGFLSYVLPPMSKPALIAGGIMTGLAALPALMAGVGALAGIGLGAAFLVATNAQVKAAGTSLLSTLKGVMTQATQPLIAPLEDAFKQLGSFFQQIEPQIQQVFGLLAPMIQPFVYALEGLVGGILPGFINLMKAAQPAVQVLAGFIGGLGASLGQMFTIMAPAVAASSVVLKDIFDLLRGLLPVIATLAGAFAQTLAPVLAEFGKAIVALSPAIIVIGKILGELAGAILTSVSGALSAIAQLITDIAPDFTILAQVLGQIFTAMENTGVFGVLEDALEKLAPPLAALVDALVKSLVPVLPVVINLIMEFSAVLVNLLADGLTALITGITAIINKFPMLIPIILGIIAAIKIWTGVQALLNIVMDANPIGLIILAVAALIIIVVEVIQHWQTLVTVFKAVWAAIVTVADGIWQAVSSAFNKVLSIVMTVVDAVVNYVSSHWKQLVAVILGIAGLIIDALATHWSAVEHGFEDAWNFVSGVVTKGINLVKAVIQPFIDWERSVFQAAWSDVEKIFQAAWNYIEPQVTAGVNAVKTALNWFSGLASMFKGWWDSANSAVNGAINTMISFVESIPGRVNSALGGLPSMMFNAGVHAIENLISGITSMIGSLGSTMTTVASKVAGFFGLSPAKEGPLSAGGAPFIRGQHLVADIMQGMLNQVPGLGQAMAKVASTVALPPGSAALGGLGSAGAASAVSSADYSAAVRQGAYDGVLTAMQQGGGTGSSIVINAGNASPASASGIAQTLRSLSELGIV